MTIDFSFVNSKKFSIMLFFCFFFIGLGYISLLPVFEGFDETAHYSRIREIENSASSMLERESYIDQVIIDYIGPMPYSSGSPPYSHKKTYDNFFNQENFVDNYSKNYVNKPLESQFHPSREINWQIQHPPLYYLLMAGFGVTTDQLSLVNQFFGLRLISFLFALTGVLFGFIALSKIKTKSTKNIVAKMRLGFLIYPFIFPMFFLEFARIGNDSLCIFFMGILSYLMLSWQQNKNRSAQPILIGFTLALALLTKALFIPISAAFYFIFVKFIYQETNKKSRQILYRNFLLALTPLLFIGGGFYGYKYLVMGDFGLGIDSLQLSEQGGLIQGLSEHFNFFAFGRGALVPLVTFFWAGTQSLVRLPFFTYAPLILCALLALREYFFISNNRSTKNLSVFLKPTLLFMYLGLVWHVLVTLALNIIPTSPGWYLHILMPLIAPLLGISFCRNIENKGRRIILKFLLHCCFIFQLVAIWSHMALFSGFAIKDLNKEFFYFGDFFSMSEISKILHNLDIIVFPGLALISFSIGFLMVVYLVNSSFFNGKR